jgi:hypothetical protein
VGGGSGEEVGELGGGELGDVGELGGGELGGGEETTGAGGESGKRRKERSSTG